MTIHLIILLIAVFLLGFNLGKAYLAKGLALRITQLHEEGDYRQAWVIEQVLKEWERKQ